MCIAGHDGYFKKVNPAFMRVLGYEERELLTTPYLDLVHPDDKEKTIKEANLLKAGSGSICFENRYLCKSGSIRWLQWNCTRTSDYLIAVARDITDMKLTERAFNDSERRLMLLLKNLPINLFIINAKGDLLACYGKGLELAGYKMDDFIGKNLLERHRHRPDLCKPILQALSGQSSLANIEYDGLNYEVHYEPVLNSEQKVDHVMGFAIMMTDQKRLQNELHHRQLANSIPHIVWMSTADGRFDYFNSRWYEFTGYAPDSLNQQSLKDVIAFDDLDRYLQVWRESLFTGEPYQIEIKLHDPIKNNYKWFLARAVPIKDAKNKVVRWFGTCTDINEHKKTEEISKKLLKENLDIKFALDQSSIIATTDALGKITYVNKKFCEISKYSEEELLGQDHKILNSGFHPKSFFANLWNTVSNGSVWSGEIKNRAKDGSEYWVSTFIVPFMGPDKKPYQYIAIRTDITNRKIAEEKLKAERLLFESTLQQMPVGVVIGDSASGVPLYKNHKATELFKWQSIHPDGTPYRAEEWPLYRAATLNETITNEDIMVVGEGGDNLVLKVSAAPVKNQSDKTIAGVMICEDRTEFVKIETDRSKLIISERAAQEASQLKSRFLANMSHEFRTPLNGVIGLSFLLKQTKLNSLQKKYLKLIAESANHLQNMVNEILDLSKIESNKLTLTEQEIDLHLFSEGLFASLKPMVKSKKVQLRLKTPSSNLQFYGDETRLRQVLLNLAQNAIKFTDEGYILVRISSKKNNNRTWLNFEIEDTGIGIDRSNLSVLFEPFTQANQSIGRTYGGFGLGLSISKRLTELMGGKIGTKNKRGKGSIFFFEIPVTKLSKRRNKLVGSQKKLAFNPKRSLRILVAEDNIVNQKVIVSTLELMGHTAEVAGNGFETLEKLNLKKYDLILMDLHMPSLDGFSTTEKIRQATQNTSDIPIIAVTADALMSTREKCIESGMNGYVSKPIDPQMLFREIEFAFRGRNEN